MGQGVNRTVKRRVKRMTGDRVFSERYICVACQTTVNRIDNFCRNCGLDIREVDDAEAVQR